VAQDFVRYIMHADVRFEAPAEPEPAKVIGMTLTSSDNVEPAALPAGPGPAGGPGDGAPGAGPAAAPAAPQPTPAGAAAAAVRPGRATSSRAQRVTEALTAPTPPSRTVVKDASQKQGRNELCNCGSGKKFKDCHGNRATKVGGGQAPSAVRGASSQADGETPAS
jgi:preprotein translocase subunit SecA